MELANQHKAIEPALGWVTPGVATRILHCHQQTLRAMAKRGAIRCARTASGRCLWDVSTYLLQREAAQRSGEVMP
jgi:hypothetical protein